MSSGQKKRRKNMTFKERKEQDLLAALDASYKREDGEETPEKDKPANNDREDTSQKSSPQKSESQNQPSRTIVYIDGENTFFQLFDELKRAHLVKTRVDLVKFDMKMLLEHMLGDLGSFDTRYYGAKLHEEHDDEDLLKRTQKMIDHKRRWIGYLSNMDVEFISAGNLVIRPDVNPITKKDELVFEEKGVDVSLAVDMTEAAAAKQVDTIVLWSSDQDLKPAMLAAQKHGVNVIYFTHETRINDVMTGSASETRLIPSDVIQKAFVRANG